MKIVLALALACAAPVQAQTTRALIVAGVGGEPRLSQQFQQDGTALRTALVQRFGAQAALLTESSAPRSDKAGITAAFSRLAADTRAGDRILIVLIGHGSAQNGSVRFNIPGPDVTAEELAQLMAPLRGRDVAVVVATSAGGAFRAALAAPGRVVATATRSGAENEEVVFARFFARALSEDVADTDKDGGVSIVEAFEYAKREVARFYQSQNRLATEHAVLGDTAAAARFVLRAGSSAAASSEAAAIQRRIDALRARKSSMSETAYEAELEKLLLELARLRRP